MTGIGPFTLLDLALLAILAISGLVAMYRGLTREVLSILSWVVAAGAVAYFIKYHRGVAEELAKQFSDPVQTSHIYIAQVAIGAPLFVIVLDHRSPDHVAHLRHRARQPGRRHRPHPRPCSSESCAASCWW